MLLYICCGNVILYLMRHDEPERPLSHRMFGANPTINAGALQYLRKNFPDKVDAYETISKGIDLYIQA